jgi:ABC-2 type transport system permease protein
VRKAWVVARHEFGVTVKRAWFVVATFVFPLLFLGIGGGMVLLAKHTVEETGRAIVEKPLGVVDLWGGLRTDPRGFQVERFASPDDARAALKEKRITSFVIIPADYLPSGLLKIVSLRRLTLSTADRAPVPPPFEDWLLENILAGVEKDRLNRARNPLAFTLESVDAAGQVSSEDALGALKRSGTAYAFFILLFISIFTSSQYLLQGMAEEKENRVMEMVLSSLTPDQLMMGKLLGLGGAGLLQLLVWVTMGVSGVVALAVQVVLAPSAVAVCFVYFLLGYLLFGSLMLGFGALGSNFRESQQLASIWSLVGISPIFVLVALLENPQGMIARVFSFVPFTAPTTMMFRYTIDPAGTPWYDLAGSIAVLLLSTALALKISARLFRVGLLLYGKRPGVREIWRWMIRSA